MTDLRKLVSCEELNTRAHSCYQRGLSKRAQYPGAHLRGCWLNLEERENARRHAGASFRIAFYD